MSNSETGIAVNVDNWKKITGIVKGFNQKYNPVNPLLKIASLETLGTDVIAAIANQKTTANVLTNAVNERQIIFDPLKSLSTQVYNIFSTCGVNAEYVGIAAGINKKIQGSRAKPVKKAPEPHGSEGTGEPPAKTISASQQSCVQQANHWQDLITLLGSHAEYIPNESELTVASLKTLQAKLVTLNDKVEGADTANKTALIARNTFFNNGETGMVGRAQAVKKYVKGVYKATSPEFAQVSKISFTKVRES
jgi:hypothetical protein